MSDDLNRRGDPEKPPFPNAVWSDKYQMWVDEDTRTPARKIADEKAAICGRKLNMKEARELLQRIEPAIMEYISIAVMDKVGDIDRERGVFSAEFRRFGYGVEWELKQIVLAALHQWPDLMCPECGNLNPKTDCPKCGDGVNR